MKNTVSGEAEFEVRGARVLPGFLNADAQQEMVADIREVARQAPFFHPETRWGKKMSVRMTSAGAVGWISDRHGYRYEAVHPGGGAWPAIPESVLAVWRAVSGVERAPDSCLVNFYDASAKMGLHQDADEVSAEWPVVSISLGDDALFRIGGVERKGPTESLWLRSGDVVVLQGTSRMAYHGIDRIRPGTSTLLDRGGRINVTLRVAL